MGLMKTHFINMQDELLELQERLHLAESTPGTTFMEVRVLRREVEQLQHRLLWRDKAARFSSSSPQE